MLVYWFICIIMVNNIRIYISQHCS